MNEQNLQYAAEMLADHAKHMNRAHKIGKQTKDYYAYQRRKARLYSAVQMARALGQMVFIEYNIEEPNMISAITIGNIRTEL